jgi:hypothetical protein
MNRDAAEAVTALGHGDMAAQLGGLDGGALPAWTRPDHEEVEFHEGRVFPSVRFAV